MWAENDLSNQPSKWFLILIIKNANLSVFFCIFAVNKFTYQRMSAFITFIMSSWISLLSALVPECHYHYCYSHHYHGRYFKILFNSLPHHTICLTSHLLFISLMSPFIYLFFNLKNCFKMQWVLCLLRYLSFSHNSKIMLLHL